MQLNTAYHKTTHVDDASWFLTLYYVGNMAGIELFFVFIFKHGKD